MKKFLPGLILFFSLITLFSLAKPTPAYAACSISASGPVVEGQPATVRVNITSDWSIGIIYDMSSQPSCSFSPSNCTPGSGGTSCSVQMTCPNAGKYTVTANPRGWISGTKCSTTVTVAVASEYQQVNCREACHPGENTTRTSSECSRLPSCELASSNPTTKEQCLAAGNSPSECSSLPSYNDREALKEHYQAALQRAAGVSQLKEIDLGFIKLSTDPKKLAGQILEFGYGLGTLLAILFIILGGYGVTTSAGDPERLEVAKGRITAAVMGLVFLFSSVLILRVIGCGLIGIQSAIICG